MRAFLGVELRSDIKDRLVHIQNFMAATRANVKWVEKENLHVTLYFLGEIEESTAQDIIRAAGGMVESWSPFNIRVQGLGAFPNLRSPRVIWSGIEEGREELSEVHARLTDVVRKLGIGSKEKSYKPHVTLGRLRAPGPHSVLAKVIEEHVAEEFGRQSVEEVVLFESRLSRSGPQHIPLMRFRFKGFPVDEEGR